MTKHQAGKHKHTHTRILPKEETKRTTKMKKKMYKFTKMKLYQQQPPACWLQQEALQSFVNSDKSYAVRSLDDGDHHLVVQQADHRAWPSSSPSSAVVMSCWRDIGAAAAVAPLVYRDSHAETTIMLGSHARPWQLSFPLHPLPQPGGHPQRALGNRAPRRTPPLPPHHTCPWPHSYLPLPMDPPIFSPPALLSLI